MSLNFAFSHGCFNCPLPKKEKLRIEISCICTVTNVAAQNITPPFSLSSIRICFDCPFHFKTTACLTWNLTPDKYYLLSVEEMHHSVISQYLPATSHLAVNLRPSIYNILKVNMWIDASLLGSMAANCLSFPESIVSDYLELDHWNVLRRLPDFLLATSFITTNATAVAKHWLFCFLFLLFCPLLCLSESHSMLLSLLAHLLYSPAPLV